MIKFLILFISYSSYSMSGTSFMDRCLSYFKSPDVKYNLSPKQGENNVYSKNLYFFVYRQLHHLEQKELSVKEAQNYVSQLENLIELINSPTLKNQQNLKLIKEELLLATKAFPKIVSFVKSEKILDYPDLDKNLILKLVLSTFSKHIKAYLTHPQVQQLDWARLNVILQSISEFGEKANAFSFYKIKRAVRQKYDLKEYINCK